MSGRPNPVRQGILLAASMAAPVALLRVVLHASPNIDLDVGPYNVHHLFLGVMLVAAGGVPLAVFRGSGRGTDLALVLFGIGLGMALDEWAYLIATDGSNASYLLPVSFWGSVLGMCLVLGYVVALVAIAHRRRRDPPDAAHPQGPRASGGDGADRGQ